MTENTPQGTPPPPEGAPPPPADETAAAPTYRPTLPDENKGSGRFAVYDLALERYVGSVQDSKPSSADARKLTGDHGYRIREV